MTNKVTKISANLVNVVSLIDDEEVKSEMGEAFAAFMLNPTVTWAKFVLTDDRTNANGERIPQKEFPNLLKSGIHMPVIMALGEISPGHPNTKPLGTITHLKEVKTDEGASAIIALAALWGQERPADVEFIKQRFAEQQPVDVSWEILYEDAELNPETNSMDLMGTVLRAATIVGNPAYAGRTPFLSIAAKKTSDATIEPDADNIAEDKLNELEQLKADLAEAQRKLDELNTKLSESTTALSEAKAETERLTGELTAKETELVPLKEFKEAADAEKQKAERLANIKNKFVEAEIEKDEEYFSGESAEKLLKLDDDQLDFMIQELKAFSQASKTSTASTKKTKIPALTGNDGEELSAKDLGKALRERGKK